MLPHQRLEGRRAFDGHYLISNPYHTTRTLLGKKLGKLSQEKNQSGTGYRGDVCFLFVCVHQLVFVSHNN